MLASNGVPPVSASHIAGITGMHHCVQSFSFFFLFFLIKLSLFIVTSFNINIAVKILGYTKHKK
jgi:hypothetical protein